jgi:hypothetical protein
LIVTAQITLTLILVVGAALFARTLNALMAKGPGVTTVSLVSFGIDCQRSGYSEEEGNRVIRRLDEMMRHSPAIQASSIARFALLTGGCWNNR